MEFCSPADKGQNYAALFTERAQKGEGIELGKEGRKDIEKTSLMGGLRKQVDGIGSPITTFRRKPFLGSSCRATIPDLGFAGLCERYSRWCGSDPHLALSRILAYPYPVPLAETIPPGIVFGSNNLC